MMPVVFLNLLRVSLCIAALSTTFLFSENLTIKIGTSNSTGLAPGSTDTNASGRRIVEGLKIYFERANLEGGVGGKSLKLISLDDKYEPQLAAENVRRLIDQDKVLAIIANGGTPTNLIVLPIIEEKKVVLFAPFTGAQFLYVEPPDRYVFTFRASYKTEMTSIIKGLKTANIKPEEIALFIQKDSFGDALYDAGMEALKKQGFKNPENLPYGQFTRNSTNVENGLASIVLKSKSPPKAIIIGAQRPAAETFIRLAYAEYPDAYFIATSAARDLEEAILPDDAKVIISQLTPFLDSGVPALKDYFYDLKAFAPDATPSVFSWGSYLTAKLFVMGLRKADKEGKLTREGIVDVFESMKDINLGIDVPVSFSPTDHQGLSEVWFTQRIKGKFITLDWNDLKDN